MLSAGLVYTLYRAVRLAFNLYIFILFVRILLTLTSISPYNSKIARFLSDLTDPFLAKIEQYMPQSSGKRFRKASAFPTGKPKP